VRTVAHWIKLTKQVMDDAPMLASYVDTRMRYGVELRLDSQLLNGDGITPNISGMMAAGNHTAFTPTGADPIVSIRQAMTQVAQADYQATAVILNPADVEAIDLTKDSQGAYVAADPRSNIQATIWGLPIVSSNAMTAGQFLTAAFPVAYQQWNRQGTTVDLSDSDDTNFQSNLYTLRAELRAMLATYRPASAVGGALSNV
jgi:HK97 family phage major capsid protein